MNKSLNTSSHLNPGDCKVGTIMTRALTTVEPGRPVADLINLFERVTFHHIPVAVEGDLKGILSDRDIARFFCEDQPDEVKTAADLMTQSIISVDPRTSVEVASILLLEGQISCLPVISEDNQLVGILTWKDLLKFYVFAT